MAAREVERKLTAVFVTDVAGYSRLMAENPDQTLETLTAYREVFSEYAGQFHGRIVNRPGDSILAEFGSVVDALTCAVEIQRELAERNLSLPENRRMQFRIGLTMGDVLLKEGELYGDGVNIAARLEALADPGGICISRNVYDQVQSRLPLHFEYLGEKIVKNIPEPVRAYKVLSEPGVAAHRAVSAGAIAAKTWRNAALAAAVLALIAVGGYFAWNAFRAPVPQGTAEREAAIAVLPFDNLSGDPAQEYFSDGLTENIITALSRFSTSVIARHSTFLYKGQGADVRKIGRELGARYVVEGSVQKSRQTLRITVQLIDAETGSHLWAESYDRQLSDLFNLQDEITSAIVGALPFFVAQSQIKKVQLKNPADYRAEDYTWKARSIFRNTAFYNKDNLLQARLLLVKALELEPEYWRAIVNLAMVDFYLAGWEGSKGRFKNAVKLAKKAVSLNPNYGQTHTVLGLILTRIDTKKALAEYKKAVELNPNDAGSLVSYGVVLASAGGRPKEAIPFVEKALLLNPFPPDFYYVLAAGVFYIAGDYRKSISLLEKIKEENEGALRTRAASHAKLGNLEEAGNQISMLLRISPNVTLKSLSKRFPHWSDAVRVDYLDGLRKAGLPEG